MTGTGFRSDLGRSRYTELCRARALRATARSARRSCGMPARSAAAAAVAARKLRRRFYFFTEPGEPRASLGKLFQGFVSTAAWSGNLHRRRYAPTRFFLTAICVFHLVFTTWLSEVDDIPVPCRLRTADLRHQRRIKRRAKLNWNFCSRNLPNHDFSGFRSRSNLAAFEQGEVSRYAVNSPSAWRIYSSSRQFGV